MNEVDELEGLEDLEGLAEVDGGEAPGPLPEGDSPYRCGCANCRKLRNTGRSGRGGEVRA
jgi:hypothetical protein